MDKDQKAAKAREDEDLAAVGNRFEPRDKTSRPPIADFWDHVDGLDVGNGGGPPSPPGASGGNSVGMTASG